MFKFVLPSLWLPLVLSWSLCTTNTEAATAVPRRGADEVLLVCNTNSAVSLSVAGDYARQRGIRNILRVSCQDSAASTGNESIPFGAYLTKLERPIRGYLNAHPRIEFIVLTKGVPIRITGAPMGCCDEHSREPENTRGRPAVDSFLAALDYTNQPQAMTIRIHGSGAMGLAFSNRYWHASEPFSHAKFGGYLVTRLDGYTAADAKALVSRALRAERSRPTGNVLLDVQPKFGLGDKAAHPAPIEGPVITDESAWDTYNADMRHVADVLARHGIASELDLAETFVGHRTNLLGYFSWGSNDARYAPDAYQTLFFAPGSLSDTAVSTSARTFLPTRGGQSLLVDLIAHGLTCGKGYVDEPLLQAIASPTIAMERYLSGYTMAESLYAASRFVGWEDVVIGDPLCCPYGAGADPKR
jgi:uncharacterized protein (TIGR03790 family)